MSQSVREAHSKRFRKLSSIRSATPPSPPSLRPDSVEFFREEDDVDEPERNASSPPPNMMKKPTAAIATNQRLFCYSAIPAMRTHRPSNRTAT